MRYGTLEAPRTTPQDLGRLLASLARGDVLSAENNQLFMDALTKTIYNTRIPLGLGFAVPVAHKTGSKDRVYNDAALILLPDNPYVLVILTRGVPPTAEPLMRQISRDLFALEKLRLQNGQSGTTRQLANILESLTGVADR